MGGVQELAKAPVKGKEKKRGRKIKKRIPHVPREGRGNGLQWRRKKRGKGSLINCPGEEKGARPSLLESLDTMNKGKGPQSGGQQSDRSKKKYLCPWGSGQKPPNLVRREATRRKRTGRGELLHIRKEKESAIVLERKIEVA